MPVITRSQAAALAMRTTTVRSIRSRGAATMQPASTTATPTVTTHTFASKEVKEAALTLTSMKNSLVPYNAPPSALVKTTAPPPPTKGNDPSSRPRRSCGRY
jgi:hypothetical protein